ncbi:MAG: 4Fe-4S dicluster domain-containing protein, partial [Candidatus Lokiarchaeota archaeon]|nr:4Fe-4S dicluster domain-containing protein [Candidatus Lokiarchaeota archaeon]
IHSMQIPMDKLQDIYKKYDKNKLITKLDNHKIVKFGGFAGNYQIKIQEKTGGKISVDVGTIIIAGGTKQYPPAEGQFKYGISSSVMTQSEFQEKYDKKGLRKISRAVILLCVNQRLDPESKYYSQVRNQFGSEFLTTSNCSNVCCARSLKIAKQIKEQNENAEIFVLYRDMQLTGGKLEQVYRELKNDVVFLRYDSAAEIEPKIIKEGGSGANGRIYISFNEVNTKTKIGLEADILVLATPIATSEKTLDLARLLKIRTEKYGFFQEEHSKVLPLNSTRKAIFLCGSVQWPNNPDLEVSQALGAAMKAANFLAEGYYEGLAEVAEIDKDKCIGCGTCIRLCPYKAITFNIEAKHYVFGDRNIRKAEVNPLICQACGICMSECPVNAIIIPNSNDGAYINMIAQFAEGKEEGN